jgi:hypothetical protein
MPATDTYPAPDDRSVADLVRQLSEDTSALVRDEMRLARAEMTQNVKHAGVGLGMFGGAGMLAFFGAAALVTAAIAGLALVLDAWAAALIVAAVLFALAGLVAYLGKGQVEQASPTPERTIDNVKRDIAEVKEEATNR